MSQSPGIWSDGTAYERYIGRWSRAVAVRFLEWLDAPPDGRWLDFGCGTGALTNAVLERCAPATVLGIDRSPEFVQWAASRTSDLRVRFQVADATEVTAGGFDVATSGLVFNFLPDPAATLAALRVAAPGGIIAAYVWDYSGGMELIHHFWEAASSLDPAVANLNESLRFPLCQPGRMAELWRAGGLTDVQESEIRIPTRFTDFDDYWAPFLGGQGPAPGYLRSLDDDLRSALKERLRATVPTQSDGSITLHARSWAVRGRS